MSEEEINKAIAEACGWEFSETAVSYPNGLKIQFHPPEYVKEVFFKEIPDYCNDLNAMHEAENMLTEKQTRTFAFMLAQVLDTTPTVDLDDQFLNIHATAIQRAEAFLKTIGKWEEAK